MKIRKIKKEEVNETSKVLSEFFFDNSAKDAKKYLLKKLQETYIAIIDKKVAGVIIYEPDYSHDANIIAFLIVSKPYCRQGIGRSLMNKFVEVSRKEQPKRQKYALSSTDVKNKKSIALHKKLGFIELGRIKKLHYGIDEIFFGYKLR